jgi:MFS family permease
MPDRRWVILAVLFSARAATGFQFQSVGSAANLLMQDLAIDYARIGNLLGAYLLPGVICRISGGIAGRRFREKTLGLAGLALMVISGVALSVCDGFVAALAACIIGGIGATVAILVATKMTTDWFDGSSSATRRCCWWRRDRRRPGPLRLSASRSGSPSWRFQRADTSFTGRAGRPRRSSPVR